MPLVSLITPGQVRGSPDAASPAGPASRGPADGPGPDPPGGGVGRQGVLLPPDPRPPALPRDQGRHPRAGRPAKATAGVVVLAAAAPSASTRRPTRDATSSSASTRTSSTDGAWPPRMTSTGRLPCRRGVERGPDMVEAIVRHALTPRPGSGPVRQTPEGPMKTDHRALDTAGSHSRWSLSCTVPASFSRRLGTSVVP